jgi:hypothetical protein
MGIKDVFNQAPSPEEEALYQKVVEELESSGMRPGVYAKALADSQGDESKAKALYIKYRVQSLIGEEKQLAGIEYAASKSEEKVKSKKLKALNKAAKRKKRKKEIRPFLIFIVLFLLFYMATLILNI